MVTRAGKVQFVSRKLKMNSSVQIQLVSKPLVFCIGCNLIKCRRRTTGGQMEVEGGESVNADAKS